MVGVSKWCKDVADVGRRPRVGDCWKLDVDEVMRLRPTLLIGSVPFATEAVEKILEQPVALLAINPRSLEDIERDIRVMGGLVGRAAAAEKLIVRMQREFDAVRRKARRIGRPVRVYSEAWPKPRISSPPWVAELIEIAGGRMAVPAGARVTDEEVARAAPEVIVLAWTAVGDRSKTSTALQNAAWKNVPAVRDERVCVIRDEWLNTPGPPLMRGVRELFRVLHC